MIRFLIVSRDVQIINMQIQSIKIVILEDLVQQLLSGIFPMILQIFVFNTVQITHLPIQQQEDVWFIVVMDFLPIKQH